jgi:prephenate dehydrogenase
MPCRVAILGVGLIGGSIGLRLRQAGWTVAGWSPSPDTRRLAVERGAIGFAAASAEDAVEGADLVVVASTIRAIPDMFRTVARAARAGAVVTDVASVKGQVLAWARELLPAHVSFVGGHPMAGKELQGVAAADARLLEGCTYCLVPGTASQDGLPAAREMVEAVGARPLVVGAEEHDRAVAAASHLPFVVSTALVRAVAGDLDGLAGQLAATGFADTTRIAMASPAMHADICAFNPAALAALIDRLQEELGAFRGRLEGEELEPMFVEAAQVREQWGRRRAGDASVDAQHDRGVE